MDKYKAAIYCRLSEEDRFKASAVSDSESITNQKKLLSDYCMEMGWEIYDIYSDDDYTGSDRNRPEFKRMLSDAEKGYFNAIICKTQSRFTREIELVEKYINYLLPLWGVRFVSIVDNADTDIKSNKKARQINGLINEWYLEDMSENIKAVLTSKRKNGHFIGAFAPYGYKKDPNVKGHLVIDEEAAQTIREIFAMYISGMGKTAIARELNGRYIPSPARYKAENGEKYRNQNSPADSLWHYYTVAGILDNRVYKGDLVQNKAHSISYKTKITKQTPKSEWITVQNTHEPIIDCDTWNIAQEMLSERSRPAVSASGINIFSGKIYCSECGRKLRMSKGSGSNNTARYLRCPTKYSAPDKCVGVCINYEKLLCAFKKAFAEIINKYADSDMLIQLIDHKIKQHKEENSSDGLQRETEAVKKYERIISQLYSDKANGIIDPNTFEMLFRSYRDEMELHKKRIDAISVKVNSNDEYQVNTKEDIVSYYLNNENISAETVNMLVRKIMIHPKIHYSRDDNIQIYWNF